MREASWTSSMHIDTLKDSYEICFVFSELCTVYYGFLKFATISGI
jgi:hypothetical protein